MGILPENVPEDLDEQITLRDMTALLTRFVAYWDMNLLPEWKTLSAKAIVSDAPLLRCDGFIALFEAAHLLGLSEWRTVRIIWWAPICLI